LITLPYQFILLLGKVGAELTEQSREAVSLLLLGSVMSDPRIFRLVKDILGHMWLKPFERNDDNLDSEPILFSIVTAYNTLCGYEVCCSYNLCYAY